MKRKIFSILFAVVLVFSLGVIALPSPVLAVMPDEVWVDDDTCPSTGSGIQLDPYCKIQDGIDAVAPNGTVHVADGTYSEDLTIGKNLTLLGAQAGVDPRGGRAGPESEIVGVIKVTSATNVVFDGFKFTSPTRGFTPRGFNLHIESASSTIRNNIFIAEENAGHTYAGYLDFGGITSTTVTQNTFSGHLDLVQDPNVILLGITGTGVVTVADNEMHDVGGGGGIGVMCTNANAVIYITGNVIDNTGNECIWVWAPGGSHFATLFICSNNLYQATVNGIKLVGTITSSVEICSNDISNNPTGILVQDGAAVASEAHLNNIAGNTNYGVVNQDSNSFNAESNWWGDATGPGPVGPGGGDEVSANVDYDPWLGARVAAGKGETTETGSQTVDATTEADVEVIKSGSGTPAICVGEYEDNPGTGFSGDIGKYIDVHIDNTAGVTEIEIRLYYTNGEIYGLNEWSLRLYWWDGSDWTECSDSGVNPADTNSYSGYIWAKIRDNTTPDLDDLVGLPFGGGGRPPVVGGTVLPVNKVGILLPWIGLAVALALVGVFIARFARRRVRS